MAHVDGTASGSGLTQRVGTIVGSLTARRDDSGGADKIAKGFEIVMTTVLVGALGALLDRWLGTAPWLMLGLGGFAFGYQVWKVVVGYEAEMRAHEDRLLPPASRARRDARRQGGQP